MILVHWTYNCKCYNSKKRLRILYVIFYLFPGRLFCVWTGFESCNCIALMLGKTDCRSRRGWQKTRWLDTEHHWFNGHWVWAISGRWWRTGKPGVLQSMGSQRVRHDWVTELNWTDLKFPVLYFIWGEQALSTPSYGNISKWRNKPEYQLTIILPLDI